MSKEQDLVNRINRNQAAPRVFPPWVVVLSSCFALVAGIGVFFLSASLLLIVTPIIAIIFIYMRWKLKKALQNSTSIHRNFTIDGDYTIIDEKWK